MDQGVPPELAKQADDKETPELLFLYIKTTAEKTNTLHTSMRTCSHNDTYLLQNPCLLHNQKTVQPPQTTNMLPASRSWPNQAKVQERKGWNIDLAAGWSIMSILKNKFHLSDIISGFEATLGYTFLEFQVPSKMQPQKTHLLRSIRKRSILLLLPTTTWASESLLHLPSIWMRPISGWTSKFHSKWANLMALPSILQFTNFSPIQKKSKKIMNVLVKTGFFQTFLRVRSSPVQPAMPGMLPRIRCKLKLPAILWPVSPVTYLMIGWFDDLMTSKS